MLACLPSVIVPAVTVPCAQKHGKFLLRQVASSPFLLRLERVGEGGLGGAHLTPVPSPLAFISVSSVTFPAGQVAPPGVLPWAIRNGAGCNGGAHRMGYGQASSHSPAADICASSARRAGQGHRVVSTPDIAVVRIGLMRTARSNRLPMPWPSAIPVHGAAGPVRTDQRLLPYRQSTGGDDVATHLVVRLPHAPITSISCFLHRLPFQVRLIVSQQVGPPHFLSGDFVGRNVI